jgi:hypothetical protein
MRLIYLTVFLLAAAICGSGQRVIDVSKESYSAYIDGQAMSGVNGLTYSAVKFVRVTSGTPFFKDEFMKGTVVLPEGKAISGVRIRLNLVDNQVNYLNSSGQEMVATNPIKNVILTDTISGTQYYFVYLEELKLQDKIFQKVWLQVLVNDKVSLCCQFRKRIHEITAYGSATTEQEILTDYVYLVKVGGEFRVVYKIDELPDLFKDKKEQVSQYIHTNHLKGRSADDFTQVVKYYNSLENG